MKTRETENTKSRARTNSLSISCRLQFSRPRKRKRLHLHATSFGSSRDATTSLVSKSFGIAAESQRKPESPPICCPRGCHPVTPTDVDLEDVQDRHARCHNAWPVVHASAFETRGA